jgi:CubicO group peptidase (beta-lactamase class C family)
MTRRAWVGIIVCAIWIAPVELQAQRVADHPGVAEAVHLLEVWMDAQRDYRQIPGISAAVVHDQELVWSEGFGYADLDRMTPATPSTMYSVCSISKLFTSIGVMQLRDKGRFRLGDDVGTLLPWFDIERSYKDGAPITVEGLLTHSSGLPRESDYPYWSDPFEFPSHDDIVSRLESQETLYPAWKYFQYSNLGLTLAGEIVAQASGTPYAEYVRQHILAPLGMQSTVSEIADVHDSDKLAKGYSATRRDGTRKPVRPFAGNGIAPAMGYASTVDDLAKFASWQFRLLKSGRFEVLAANTLREMHRVHYMDPGWRTSWGLGFSVSRNDDKTFVGHGGSCPGYRSNLVIQTDDEIATIVMSNAMINTGLFTRQAYRIVAPAIATAKSDSGDVKLMPETLAKYTGLYDSYPWGGETQVIPWKGSLAMVSFPTDDPLGGLTRLKHVEGGTFQRVRSDDSLGDEIVFETDSDGTVLRMWVHSNSSEKLR